MIHQNYTVIKEALEPLAGVEAISHQSNLVAIRAESDKLEAVGPSASQSRGGGHSSTRNSGLRCAFHVTAIN
jgi:hypothetical protein